MNADAPMISGVICPPTDASGFERCRHARKVTVADHRRNRDYADGGDVRRARARDGGKQRAGENRDLARRTARGADEGLSKLDEKIAAAHAHHECAEQDEHIHVGGAGAERGAENAFQPDVHRGDHLREAEAGMSQQPRQPRADERIDEEAHRNDRERSPRGAASRLGEQHDQDRAEHYVGGRRIDRTEDPGIGEFDRGVERHTTLAPQPASGDQVTASRVGPRQGDKEQEAEREAGMDTALDHRREIDGDCREQLEAGHGERDRLGDRAYTALETGAPCRRVVGLQQALVQVDAALCVI